MEAFDSDLIQVLWVEDDPKVIGSYPLKAEELGLELHDYSCWDDARVALEKDYDRWSAIILDAKCKFHREDPDNAVKFLAAALKDIAVISKEKRRIIPWYVLTGGAESEVSDSIIDDRMKWDADWTEATNKNYYSKNIDNETLFRRIRYYAKKSPQIQIREMYRNVFEAMKECEIDNNGCFALEDLLIPIHFLNEVKYKDYNGQFVKAREVLEYTFRSMASHGILPDWGKKINLRWSCLILSGVSAKRKSNNGEDITVIESKYAVLPPVLKRVLREMADIIPAFCHSDTEDDGEIKKEEYLSSVSNSPFLLKSFALQLCDLILWYNGYINTHPNVDDNKMAWRDNRNSKLQE